MAPPPRPPPELVADIVGEILLLLPPTDPATLVRASVVCKLWRRLLADPSFHRRYRAIHDTPLLGFLHDHYTYGAVSVPRFVSTLPRRSSPFPQPKLGHRDCSGK
nr:unnamed protein product [Digitaria exilis]